MKLRIDHAVLSNFTAEIKYDSETDIVADIKSKYNKLRELYHILDNSAAALYAEPHDKYTKTSALAEKFTVHASIINDFTIKAISHSSLEDRFDLESATELLNNQTALLRTTFYLLFRCIEADRLTKQFKESAIITNNKIVNIKQLLVASNNNFSIKFYSSKPKINVSINYDYLTNSLPMLSKISESKLIEHILSKKNKVIDIINAVKNAEPKLIEEVAIFFIKNYSDSIENQLNDININHLIKQFNVNTATELYNSISSLIAVSIYNILYSINYYENSSILKTITLKDIEVLHDLRHKIKAFNK